MGELQLNNRLKKVATFVRQDTVVADIGTDHGYLPVWLLLNGKIQRAIAADINEGPLSKAAETVQAYGVSDKVQLVLSDGLARVDVDAVDDIVIAGMGGELIAEILDRCPAVRDPSRRLILQPMTNADRLRRYLCENGFTIKAEAGVTDRRFTYCVLCVEYSGRVMAPDDFYLAVGEMPRNTDAESRLYIKGQITKIEKKINGLKKASQPQDLQQEEALLERLQKAYDNSNEG